MMVGRGGVDASVGSRRAVGVHLMPLVDAVESARPSVVVELDETRAVGSIVRAATIREVVAAIGTGPATVAVDAPLRVANARGRRAIETLLAWLDVPAFPVSRARAEQVWGGLRGEELAAALADRDDLDVVEAVPELMLRALAWRERFGAGAVDLADFRAGWLDIRPAPYRPKGRGRARSSGIVAAASLLGARVDLGGWLPSAVDDWDAIASAATIDAILAADAAWGVVHGDGVVVATDDGTRCALAPLAPLTARAAVNVARLDAEGTGMRIEPGGPR